MKNVLRETCCVKCETRGEPQSMHHAIRTTECILITRCSLLMCFNIPALHEACVMVDESDNLPEDDQEEHETWYAENQTNSEEGKINVTARDIGSHLHIERGIAVQGPSGSCGE